MTEKNIKIVTIFLIFLILLIFLTTFLEEDDEIIIEEISITKEVDEYKIQLEKDILKLLNLMEGVGGVEVLITLENGVENIYVTEESFTTDTATNNLETSTQKRTGETTALLVEDANGRKQALIKTVKQPQIRGVLIVCEGGDNIQIKARVTEAVKALLNISSTRIYVTN